MKPLKAAATTSQPVLTVAQIETIFFKVPELYEIHKEFYDSLLPRVQQWGHHQRVGDLFQKQVSVCVCVCVIFLVYHKGTPLISFGFPVDIHPFGSIQGT